MLFLYLDSDGDLWLGDDASCDATLLGPIEGAVDRVPESLWAEYERLLDDYNDSLRAGETYVRTVESAYRAQSGV